MTRDFAFGVCRSCLTKSLFHLRIRPSPPSEAGPSSTGLPSNVAAAIACLPLIGGIIFYMLEKRDSFVRFYAMQSIIFGGAWILFAIVYSIAHAILTPIPAIGLFFCCSLVGYLGLG